MGGPGSGPRPGNPGNTLAVGFRQWCRDVVGKPEVRKAIEDRCLTDPEFALRVCDHGYGRPPQALDVRTADVTPAQQQIYTAQFDDSLPVASTNGAHSPAAPALPVPAIAPDGPSA